MGNAFKLIALLVALAPLAGGVAPAFALGDGCNYDDHGNEVCPPPALIPTNVNSIHREAVGTEEVTPSTVITVMHHPSAVVRGPGPRFERAPASSP